MTDCWDEIESDLSVFHRVDDWRSLSGPRLLRLARLLGCYAGALQARLAREQQATPVVQQVSTPASEAPRLDDVRDLVALTNQNGFAGFEYAG